MPRIARQVLVVLLGLAVTMGGLGRVTPGCADDLPATHVHEHGHGAHGGHQHHGDNRHATKQPVSTPACLKCCGICIADTALARGPALVVSMRGRPVVFFTAFKTYKDRPFFIDPGIPKLTA